MRCWLPDCSAVPSSALILRAGVLSPALSTTFPSSAFVKLVGCSGPEFNYRHYHHHHTFYLLSALSGSCTRFAGSLGARTLVPFVLPGSGSTVNAS